MSRPHSRIFVRTFEDCSQARWTPPSWATESSPYSLKTLAYSSSARSQPDGGVEARVAGDVELVDELVEEQPAEALGRARVAGEQGALDDLGQVHEREHRPVEIREVPAEQLPLAGGELLSARDRHARTTLRRGLSTGADGAVLDGDRRPPTRRRPRPRSRRSAAARALLAVSSLPATTATWRSRSMTCFTLRTKSPPDMTGTGLLASPARPHARLQDLAEVAAPGPVVDERRRSRRRSPRVTGRCSRRSSAANASESSSIASRRRATFAFETQQRGRRAPGAPRSRSPRRPRPGSPGSSPSSAPASSASAMSRSASW